MTDDPKGERLAAARTRSGELLRKLDGERPVTAAEEPKYAPTCERPGVALERGHATTLVRCLGCKAVTYSRNVHPTPKAKR